MTAVFEIKQELIDEIIEATKDGEKIEPELEVKVKDAKGETICEISKLLYVRRK